MNLGPLNTADLSREDRETAELIQACGLTYETVSVLSAEERKALLYLHRTKTAKATTAAEPTLVVEEVAPQKRNILRIDNADRQMVINITGDGRVEFGPGYKGPDEAARLFWQCLGTQYLGSFQLLGELVTFIENHKALKNTDPIRALVEAKKVLGR